MSRQYEGAPDVEAAIELLKESGIGIILNVTFKHPIDLDRRYDNNGNPLPIVIENNTFFNVDDDDAGGDRARDVNIDDRDETP